MWVICNKEFKDERRRMQKAGRIPGPKCILPGQCGRKKQVHLVDGGGVGRGGEEASGSTLLDKRYWHHHWHNKYSCCTLDRVTVLAQWPTVMMPGKESGSSVSRERQGKAHRTWPGPERVKDPGFVLQGCVTAPPHV